MLCRKQRFDLIQIFKIINGFVNIDATKFFTLTDNNTRGHLLEKQQIKKSLRLNSFPIRCIHEWNNLPEEIVCKPSVDGFKIALATFFKIPGDGGPTFPVGPAFSKGGGGIEYNITCNYHLSLLLKRERETDRQTGKI